MEGTLTNFASILNALIASVVADLAVRAADLDVEDIPHDEFIASETVGEVIDKLIILNIRTWHLEDRVDGASDEEMLILQRKLRHCFRYKRPRLVAALNRMLKEAVVNGRLDLLEDEDVKTYKGDG